MVLIPKNKEVKLINKIVSIVSIKKYDKIKGNLMI